MKALKLKTSYSQRDGSWSNILLGFNTSRYYIGTDGCLITSITNYLNAVGKNETPATINEKIKGVYGFVRGSGLFMWESLNKVFNDVSLFYTSPRFDGVETPPAFFDSMRSYIDKGHALLLEVDFNPSQNGEQMHWVLVYGYDGDDFLISDPWSGAKTNLNVYGDPKNSCFMFRTYSLTLPEEGEGDCKTQLAKTKKELEAVNSELNKKSGQITALEDKLTSQKALTISATDLAKTNGDKYKQANDLLKIEITKNEGLTTSNLELKNKIDNELLPEIERLKLDEHTLPELFKLLIEALKRWKAGEN